MGKLKAPRSEGVPPSMDSSVQIEGKMPSLRHSENCCLASRNGTSSGLRSAVA